MDAAVLDIDGKVVNIIAVSGESPDWIVIPTGQSVNIGDIYDGTTFSPPAKDIETIRLERLALMDSTYETLEHEPIAYMGTVFQADDYSQDLIAKTLVALGGVTPADLGWWDVTNTRVLMTNAQLQGLGQAIFARNQPLYINKQARKAAIRAAITVAEIEAVVW